MSEDTAMHGAPERVRMTYDDLLALPDDGLRHELIDGEHFVTPSPASVHQLIVGNLYVTIGTFLRVHRLGILMLAPFDVVFSPYDVVEPDLIYFSAERFKAVVGEKTAQGPPDLAVEVMSPSTRRRDEVLKRRLFERSGVAEYWIVDPELETVNVHRPVSGKYRRAELSLENNDVLATPLLPQFSMSLSSVFELP